MKILSLVTDAFGGRGGIAQFNQKFLTALSSHPACEEILVLPRIVMDDVGPLPDGLDFDLTAARGKLSYLVRVVQATKRRSFDTVICGHINLLPMAALIAKARGVPLVLVIYGIEAWEPPKEALRRAALRHVDHVFSISRVTADRFLLWSGVSADRIVLLPCCIDFTEFRPGPRRPDLLTRHQLEGRTVLLTVARLAGAERYKGFDEVIEVLPLLAETIPNITYLIAGDGPDRARLERKVSDLGLGERVIFAGYLKEEEKADYYRLADAFVMPGRGEGFGIVYLEAMACQIPVVGSVLDASREVLRDGALGEVVDPNDPQSIVNGILRAVSAGRRNLDDELESYSVRTFTRRCHAIVDELVPLDREALVPSRESGAR